MSNQDPGSTGTAFEFNLRFAGQYFDRETGLHYNYYRTYDPATGRYVESDPIGLVAGPNTYSYVGDNPISRIDPFGLDWVFSQSTGQVTHVDSSGNSTYVGTGYSGHGEGVNNPAMQNVPNIGPITQGTYDIGPQQNNTTNNGTHLPASMRLTPQPGTNTFGRNGFIIHGDNGSGNQSASEGCPVLVPSIRNQIGNSGDTTFRVVP